jgi:hypothetical protein
MEVPGVEENLQMDLKPTRYARVYKYSSLSPLHPLQLPVIQHTSLLLLPAYAPTDSLTDAPTVFNWCALQLHPQPQLHRVSLQCSFRKKVNQRQPSCNHLLRNLLRRSSSDQVAVLLVSSLLCYTKEKPFCAAHQYSAISLSKSSSNYQQFKPSAINNSLSSSAYHFSSLPAQPTS